MSEDNAQTDDVPPGNVSTGCPESVAEHISGLSDDLQQSLDCQPPQPILFLGFAPLLDDVCDLVSSVKNVQHSLVVAPAHNSTESSIMS
jgi:hypothetical protein